MYFESNRVFRAFASAPESKLLFKDSSLEFAFTPDELQSDPFVFRVTSVTRDCCQSSLNPRWWVLEETRPFGNSRLAKLTFRGDAFTQDATQEDEALHDAFVAQSPIRFTVEVLNVPGGNIVDFELSLDYGDAL
jgi:hypothetical protein